MPSVLIGTLFAQARTSDDVASGISGLLCCAFWCGLPILWFGINIAILFWVAKDAKSRGMDGAMWIFLILFTGIVGVAIYLFSRPQGLLMQCPNCGNNRMQASIKCPHCGAAQHDDQGARRKRRGYDDDDENEPHDRSRR